jgi:hypothetical protein
MLDKDDIIFQYCIDKWGLEFQAKLAIEEMGELIEQLGKTLKSTIQFERGRIDGDDIVEEFVDTYLMMQQMRFMNKEKFDKIYEQKVNRIRERLEK